MQTFRIIFFDRLDQTTEAYRISTQAESKAEALNKCLPVAERTINTAECIWTITEL